MLQPLAVSTRLPVGTAIHCHLLISSARTSPSSKKGFCQKQGRDPKTQRSGNRNKKPSIRKGGDLAHTCVVTTKTLIRVDEEVSNGNNLKLLRFPLPGDKEGSPFALNFNSDNSSSASWSLPLLKQSPDSPTLDISLPLSASHASSPSFSFTVPLPKEITISLSMPLQQIDATAAMDLTTGSTLEVTAGKNKAAIPVPGQQMINMLHSLPIHAPHVHTFKMHLPQLLSAPFSLPM